ncbi:MAG: cupin domain-containing protein [Thermomicrobiales bacterium]
MRYTYQPGSVFPLHIPSEEQLTIVHSGEIEFTVGGEKVVLKEGMLATILPASTRRPRHRRRRRRLRQLHRVSGAVELVWEDGR